MGFRQIAREFFGKKYIPLNRIKISKQKLLANYSYLSSLSSEMKIAPVLKSNAYGHGICEIAKILDPLGAPFFCVDSLYEAYALLKAKIKTPVLIMGYIHPENLKVKKLPFSYSVYDEELLQAISKYQPGANVHIFVDTGMHREGVVLEDLPNFLKVIKKLHVKVYGLQSHLAIADNPRDPLTQKQIDTFHKAYEILKKHHVFPEYLHMNASVGLLEGVRVGNVARVGKALYGIDPRRENPRLQPILKLTSHIVQIKLLRKGDRVGYDGTYTAKQNTTMAVIPMGYYDGIDRRLSNIGSMMVEGVECPIIGRVSMNITTIDISHIKNPYVGQEVVVYSDDSSHPNSILHTARLCSTIPYEIISHLDPSIRREVV